MARRPRSRSPHAVTHWNYELNSGGTNVYTLIHTQASRSVVIGRESVAVVSALVVAEVFYKFGSFTLEAVAFIATWYLIGWLASLATDRDGPRA